MLLRQLFDRETSTYSYLLADDTSHEALLIDPVLEQVERDMRIVRELGLKLRYVLETHVHADHVTASGALREKMGATTVASLRGAACANMHIAHGDTLTLGTLVVHVLGTPGHTDDSLSFHVGNHVFTGDALLVRGTGRTDFQNGDPGTLYDSITQVLFALPPETIVWPAHDYQGHSSTTIGEERRVNPRVAGKTRDEFIAIMNNLQLPRPAQLDRAVPLNRSCGAATLNQAGPSAQVRDVDPKELSALKAGTRIIDVREPEEWQGELGHLPEAELVPLDTLDGALVHWDKKLPVLLVCRSGRRSLEAARKLVQQGFEQVLNLRGGMTAYRNQGRSQP
jgi:glyoxylase-like metal-dependent hydrolase (beta-lactamase superfamily II)/rhodanese-related sulfurtransferase